MPTTPKTGLIYPTEEQKPFWNIWEAFMSQLDAALYVSLEEPNLVLRGGGIVSINTSTDAMTWTEDLELMNLLTGGLVTISANSLSGMEAGKIAYVEVSRPVSGSTSGTLLCSDSIGDDLNKVFVAIRRGDDLYMRNHVNREAMISFSKWNTSKIVTASASASGSVNGSIVVGVEEGAIWRTRITANGDTADTDIRFFSDAGLTEEMYTALTKDCYPDSPRTYHDDRVPWWCGQLTDGILYYRFDNNGANASTYDIEIAGFGKTGA